jgi:hypothetical protein
MVVARALGRPQLFEPEDTLLTIIDDTPAPRPWRSWESEPVVWIDGALKMCPPNPSGYGHQAEATPWRAPSLGDFTDTPWGELSADERKSIGRCFAFAANWPPETFGDLHLPHHDPQSHDVNARACRNALARLNQVSGMSSASDRRESAPRASPRRVRQGAGALRHEGLPGRA